VRFKKLVKIAVNKKQGIKNKTPRRKKSLKPRSIWLKNKSFETNQIEAIGKMSSKNKYILIRILFSINCFCNQ